MSNILNPLEKELLIGLYRSNPGVRLSGLYRSRKTPSILPEGVDETEESLRRELIRTRIELERLKKLRPDFGGRWDAGRVRACIREEYAVVEVLSGEFPVAELCRICGVSRSGYYKWRERGGEPPRDRARILRLVRDCHDARPSHGCRWVHAYLKKSDGIAVSAEYVRRCFLYLGIRAETKHQRKDRRRKARDPCPNLVFSTWETVDRPRQVVVSDMTAFWTRSRYWELALYFDVFTKQIIGRGLTRRRGWPGIYHDGLEQAREEIERSKVEAVGRLEAGSGDVCVLHTDQGSVYTSKAYNEIIRESNIVRSCSRAGKPTDNPVNESLNGWIKEELFCDFGLYEKQDWEVEGLDRRLHRVVQLETALLVFGVHDAERLLRRLHGGGGGEARNLCE